jgi:hypothetical protein
MPFNAGVIDKNVERSERSLDDWNKPVGRGGVSEVARRRMHAVFEFGGQRLQRLAPRPGKSDRRSLGMERPRDCAAKSA